jgi:hypothetical protein
MHSITSSGCIQAHARPSLGPPLPSQVRFANAIGKGRRASRLRGLTGRASAPLRLGVRSGRAPNPSKAPSESGPLRVRPHPSQSCIVAARSRSASRRKQRSTAAGPPPARPRARRRPGARLAGRRSGTNGPAAARAREEDSESGPAGPPAARTAGRPAARARAWARARRRDSDKLLLRLGGRRARSAPALAGRLRGAAGRGLGRRGRGAVTARSRRGHGAVTARSRRGHGARSPCAAVDTQPVQLRAHSVPIRNSASLR